MKKIIVIPAYEPDDMLIKVVKEASATGCEVVVVNDGSKSEYDTIFCEVRKSTLVLSYDINHGKGYALKTAFSYIHEQFANEEYCVVTMDSDGQHSIEDALNVMNTAIANRGALILGSRLQSSSSPIKSRIGNGLTRLVYRMSSGIKVRDTQTGLRAFDSSLMELMLDIDGDRYEYEMNMLLELARQNINIIEVPIRTIYIDNNSGTHFNPIRDSFTIYKEIFKYSLSSIISFIIDYSLYSILLAVLGVSWILCANVLARVVSASVNFTINYKYVFKADGKVLLCAFKYIILALLVLVCNTAILKLLVEVLLLNPFLAKLMVEIVMYIINWAVQHFVVFKKR